MVGKLINYKYRAYLKRKLTLRNSNYLQAVVLDPVYTVPDSPGHDIQLG